MATSNIYFNREGITRLEFDIGTSPSLKYASVTVKIGDVVVLNTGSLPKGQEYYDWTISDADKALIISLMPNTSNEVTGKMIVDVIWEPWGLDAHFASKEYTVSFILEETEETKPSLVCVSKMSSAYSNYVQGKTKLIYTIKAEAKNGATLNNPTANVNERSYNLLDIDDDGNYVLQSDWLVYSGTSSISVTITDSRGFSRTLSDEIYVHPYAPPILSSLSSESGVVCRRWRPDTEAVDDMYGTECRVVVGVYAPYIPGIQTSYILTYRYKEKGATEWSEYLPVGDSNEVDITETGITKFEAIITDGTATNESGVLVGKFDIKNEYDIELKVKDNLGGIATRYEQLQCQETSFNINDDGTVVAVGKYASNNKHRLFDSAWDVHSDENISADKNIFVGKTLYINGTAVTVSAEELNFCAGLIQNAQAQLNQKAPITHKHLPSAIYANNYGSELLDNWISSQENSLTKLWSDFSNLQNRVNGYGKWLEAHDNNIASLLQRVVDLETAVFKKE